jgi:hypothetical protein
MDKKGRSSFKKISPEWRAFRYKKGALWEF